MSSEPRTPLNPLPKMPYPADLSSADGYDAFGDSVQAVRDNDNIVVPWTQFAADAYVNPTFYNQSGFIAQTGWRIEGVGGVKTGRLVHLAAMVTYTGAGLTVGADCVVVGGPINIFSMGASIAPMRPALTFAPTVARFGDTAVSLLVGYPSLDMVCLLTSSVPSRGFATNTVLYINAWYHDQTYDSYIAP